MGHVCVMDEMVTRPLDVRGWPLSLKATGPDPETFQGHPSDPAVLSKATHIRLPLLIPPLHVDMAYSKCLWQRWQFSESVDIIQSNSDNRDSGKPVACGCDESEHSVSITWLNWPSYDKSGLGKGMSHVRKKNSNVGISAVGVRQCE